MADDLVADDLTSGAAVDPVPAGYTSLTPFLVVDGARRAIDFYVEVFGATVVTVMDGPGGTVAHAELDFGHGRLQLSDPSEQFGLAAPAPGPAVTHSTVLYHADVDAVVARAVAAGATLREEVSTFVTGDRFGSIVDPFGQRWAVMTRVEDVSPEEAERRLAEWGSANLV
ncbi:VOC family protein [Kineococcus glutinatus]|uniref:VOC family protein n=1 Tax=Kineococcus glutinatus TaxID=1070872 RepID=A0ABP9HEN0_9ACTN